MRCCRFAALAAKDEAVAQSARCDSSVPAFFWAQKQARLLCWVSSKAATVSQPLGCGELERVGIPSLSFKRCPVWF